MVGEPKWEVQRSWGLGAGCQEPDLVLAWFLPAVCVLNTRMESVSPFCLSRLGKITLLSGEAQAEGSGSIELAQSALMHELFCSIERPALS